MARRGEAVDLFANGPAEMHARLSPRRSFPSTRVLQAGLEKVEPSARSTGTKSKSRNKTEMKEQKPGAGPSRSREEARAEKKYGGRKGR